MLLNELIILLNELVISLNELVILLNELVILLNTPFLSTLACHSFEFCVSECIKLGYILSFCLKWISVKQALKSFFAEFVMIDSVQLDFKNESPVSRGTTR